MSIPPEEPTRRLPAVPAQDPAVPPPAYERVAYEAGPPPGPDPLAEIVHRLRSLRTAVALVGLLSALALGAGIWALIEAQRDDDGPARVQRTGASTERVRDLEERVDRVESRTGDAPSGEDVGEVREQQEELAGRVEALEERAEQTPPVSQETVENLQQQVGELAGDVELLGQRVEAIEEQGAQP
jgi:TolA-binding protein